MSCKQVWRVTLDGEEHTVESVFTRSKGRMTVTIDGDSFDIPCGFLGCQVARREPFRLGDYQAVLAVDRHGHAVLIVDGDTVPES